MARSRIFVCAVLFCFFQGCAHIPLKRNVVKQSQTLGSLYEQQVMEGLATFATSPNVTASFALPTAGGATLNQAGTALGGLTWNATTFTGGTTGINGSQSLSENWTLKPINDPIRLSLMKCVYQHATNNIPTDCCEDCTKNLTLFFGDDFATCRIPQCFFEVASKRPARNDCCLKYAEACGCYIVVRKGQFDNLSRLTSAILEIATVSDEELGKRLSRNEPKRIEISTSFIANVGGRPQLIQGKYSIPFSKFEELQGAAIPKLEDTDKRFGPLGTGSKNGEIQFQDLQALPPESGSSSRQQTDDPTATIQSLLQMNQFPLPK